MIMKKGIDVSRWNVIKDYYALKRNGVEFAIVKVNNAGNVADTRFHEHVTGFNAAGIPIQGGYNYCYANTEEKAKRASDNFVALAMPYNINWMWLDLEDASVKGLGSKILTIISIYRKAAEQAGMKFGIYTGPSYYKSCLQRYKNELTNIPFWWARYPSTQDKLITDPVPTTKNLPRDLDMDGWQYSSKGRVNGAQGYLDLNVWYSDRPVCNTEIMIPVEYNPFTEPIRNVTVGITGNDANWVLWYLWRFGKIIDVTLINGVITAEVAFFIKEVQSLLGLTADGIVGKNTRAVWKKIC